MLLLQELKRKLSTRSHAQHPLFAAAKDQALERSPGLALCFHRPSTVLCSGLGQELCWSCAMGRPRAAGGLGCVVVPHRITAIFSALASAARPYLSLFGLLFSVSCHCFPILAQHQVGSSCRCIFVSMRCRRGSGGGRRSWSSCSQRVTGLWGAELCLGHLLQQSCVAQPGEAPLCHPELLLSTQ